MILSIYERHVELFSIEIIFFNSSAIKRPNYLQISSHRTFYSSYEHMI